MVKLIFATYPMLYRQLIPVHLKFMLESGVSYNDIWEYWSFPDDETMQEFFIDNPDKMGLNDWMVGDEILVHVGKKLAVNKEDKFMDQTL